MRPLEMLLLAADLLAFLLLAVRLGGRARRLRHGVPLVLPVLAVHLLVEGPRWQMIPAYVLSGVFAITWLVGTVAAARRSAEGRTSRLAAGLAVGLGVLGLAVAAALPVAVPVFHFPRPTGPHQVGTLTYHWVDAGRPEVFTAAPDDRRELMVQVWYPAKADPSASRSHWIPDARVVTPLARLLRLPEFALGHARYVTTNAIPSAPVADGKASYPVLVFAHGRGGFRQHNTAQIEELASHGYVVAAIDHPYAASGVAFPDGRLATLDPRLRGDDRTFLDGIIPYLAQDAVFTLDRLTTLNQADPKGVLAGRLDLRHAGIFGVSLGGVVSGEACRLEPRFRACLVMDAFMPADVVRAGLRQPTMWLTRDAATMRREGWNKADIDEHQTTMRAVFERLPAAGYFVRVPGMFHADFSDAPLLSPLASRVGLSGPIGGRRARDIVNAYSLAFFDRHLQGHPSTLLDGPSTEYPEVRIQTR